MLKKEVLQKVKDAKGTEASVKTLVDQQVASFKADLQQVQGLPPEVMQKLEQSISGLKDQASEIVAAVMENPSDADAQKFAAAGKKHGKN